jgi:hypothetical protein
MVVEDVPYRSKARTRARNVLSQWLEEGIFVQWGRPLPNDHFLAEYNRLGGSRLTANW